jgi:WHG domain-containing protein
LHPNTVRNSYCHSGPADGRIASSHPRLEQERRSLISYALATDAFREPGLFRLAFGHGGQPVTGPEPLGSADDPYTLLSSALDDLVTVSWLPATRRPNAEIAAWAAVHGVAVLCLDGLLAGVKPRQRNAFVDRTIDGQFSARHVSPPIDAGV